MNVKVKYTLPKQRDKVESGDLMAFVYFCTVDNSSRVELKVNDLDRDNYFYVRGSDLIESGLSADKYSSKETVTKIRLAEILSTSFGKPFTVCFQKQDGSERVLRGRLIEPEPLLGRSRVEDLDKSGKENRFRQVDHRTLQWIIVDDTLWVLK